MFSNILLLSAGKLTFINLSIHGINFLYVIVDLCITAIPIRLIHIYLPVLCGVVFTFFSITYDLSGGTNVNGECCIYKKLDWDGDMLSATVTCIVLECGTVVTWLVLWSLYHIRVWIYDKYYGIKPTIHKSVHLEPGKNAKCHSQLV